MRFSTGLLLAVLVLLVGHYPWLPTLAFGGVAWALEQPAALAALALGIVVYRTRRGWA